MRIRTGFFFVFALALLSFFLFSCRNEGQNDEKSTSQSPDSAVKTQPTPSPSAGQVDTRAETFDVADSTGNHVGWGYDIYVNGKKTLHQPIIPQVSGNHYFQTQGDAQKVGDLVALRMRTMGGAFYSVTVSDLDSLGIKP